MCRIEEAIIHSKVLDKLRALHISKRAQEEMICSIQNDAILAMMQLDKNTLVKMRRHNGFVYVHIGGRDLEFDTQGHWIGSGTMMKDVKWKPNCKPSFLQKKIKTKSTRRKTTRKNSKKTKLSKKKNIKINQRSRKNS